MTMTVHQQNFQLLSQLFAVEAAKLAEQIAAQSGRECPRPVPEDLLREACQILYTEALDVQTFLQEKWKAYEEDPQPEP